VTWTQVYDPAGHWWLSTLIAALPIIVLLGLLAGLKTAGLCYLAMMLGYIIVFCSTLS
jgi:L-lactate permease